MPMPITQLLQAMSGTCRYCNQPAGFLRKQHDQCRQTHQAGIQEITQLAAQAADASSFNETALRSTLQAIADRARATPLTGVGINLWTWQAKGFLAPFRC